jgi:hypothetical protein
VSGKLSNERGLTRRPRQAVPCPFPQEAQDEASQDGGNAATARDAKKAADRKAREAFAAMTHQEQLQATEQRKRELFAQLPVEDKAC